MSAAGTSRQLHFSLMKLPLEIHLMIYTYITFAATFVMNADVLTKYFKEKPINICGLIDASAIMRAEAFQLVLRCNDVNLIGLKQILHHVDTYVARTQVRGFSFWANIRTVRIDIKTSNTIQAAKAYLPLCTNLKLLKLARGRQGVDIMQLCRAGRLHEALDRIESLETISIVYGAPLKADKSTVVPRAELPEGAPTSARYIWNWGQD